MHFDFPWQVARLLRADYASNLIALFPGHGLGMRLVIHKYSIPVEVMFGDLDGVRVRIK